jgi:Fe-S-cluster containining protein
MDEQPWFKDGLRFTCTGCGDCCTGAPGFVWVNREEIEDLARKVKLSPTEFEERYVRKVGIRKSLVEYENGDCVFFDANSRKCAVYEARPKQCKTWPFWQSNMASEKTWRETCEVCPGSGTGKLHSAEHILHQIAIVKL